MLKRVEIKKESLTSCYFIGGHFLSVFENYFKTFDEDIEVFIETPKGIMMSVLVYMDSKYDGAMLELYNNYADGVGKTWDMYPELTRDELLNQDFIEIMMDRDIVSCKVI